jgi:hypothetical protein
LYFQHCKNIEMTDILSKIIKRLYDKDVLLFANNNRDTSQALFMLTMKRH